MSLSKSVSNLYANTTIYSIFSDDYACFGKYLGLVLLNVSDILFLPLFLIFFVKPNQVTLHNLRGADIVMHYTLYVFPGVVSL
jgi:hypothetical protein